MAAVVEDLASLPQSQVHEFLGAGMGEDRQGMPMAAAKEKDIEGRDPVGLCCPPPLRHKALAVRDARISVRCS